MSFHEQLSHIEILAPIVSMVMLYAFLNLRGRELGPGADYWEYIRRYLLPPLDRLLRERELGYAAYTLRGEHILTVEESPEEVEMDLFGAGALRMPFAAYKRLPDGRHEVGSWAFRESILDTRQQHVILFEAEDGGTEIHGHDEPNALNPLTAVQHYAGIGVKKAAPEVRAKLPW